MDLLFKLGCVPWSGYRSLFVNKKLCPSLDNYHTKNFFPKKIQKKVPDRNVLKNRQIFGFLTIKSRPVGSCENRNQGQKVQLLAHLAIYKELTGSDRAACYDRSKNDRFRDIYEK